jgi:N6-L-threonylcarbamoyladenine synthase
MTLVLGIETSCDETSASVLEGDVVMRGERDGGGDERGNDVHLRSLVILSQDVHRVFGGVVPEIASRAHMRTIAPVTERALEEAGIGLSDLDAIAVTHAPGLVGALLVGVSYAKTLAFTQSIPVVGVHHMEGHLFATSLEHPDAVPPFTALLVSGGHTLLLDVEAWGSYRLLGVTRDDAAGEAFDKVARMLGLPYPGGRHVEALAAGATADTNGPRFTRPMLRRDQVPGDRDYFDFSFSGIKTAVLLEVRERERKGGLNHLSRAAIARAFQDAVVDTLAQKTLRAATLYSRERIVLGGGVACNKALQSVISDLGSRSSIAVYSPSPRLATDNAAMIARAGLFRFGRGELADLSLNAFASLPIPGLAAA